mgnify:CR=1 FL=1
MLSPLQFSGLILEVFNIILFGTPTFILLGYSYAETLDLISDGPIEGIVNRHGRVVDNTEVLQGIYLNDTAVAVTPAQRPADAEGSLSESEVAKIENLKPMKLADGSSTGVKQMRYFFQALNSHAASKKITQFKGKNGIGSGPDNYESYPPSGGVNMLYMRTLMSLTQWVLVDSKLLLVI